MKTNYFKENLKSFKKLMEVRFLNKRYPLSVTHIITTKCIFRCNYCNIWKHEEKEMTTDQIFKMIDEFAEMGMGKYGISGGEPLLRDDIGKIIDYASKKGITTTLFTNCGLLKGKIDQLKNLNILLTSFDGPRDVHDKNRMKGAYDKAIDGIKLAREKGIQVWGGVTLTKNNIDHINYIIEKAKELDICLLIQPIYVYKGYSAPREKIEEMSEFGPKYIEAIDKIIKRKKQGYPILNSVTYLKYMKKPHDQKPNTPCWAGRCYCAITPSGKVSPCFKIYNQEDWPDGIKIGFKNAFLGLPKKFSCIGCFSYATTESNLFYSLHPKVFLNTYFNIIRRSKR